MADPAIPEVPKSSIEERLRRLVSGILGGSPRRAAFSRDDTLAEVGLGSMDMISLMLAVENEFSVAIPQEEITPESFRSVSTIEALILRLAPDEQQAVIGSCSGKP